MFICQECGGQNGLHFAPCPHYASKPRVHAFTRPSVGTGAGPLPYMHSPSMNDVNGKIRDDSNFYRFDTSPTGRVNTEQPQIQNLPDTLAHAIEMAEAKHGPAYRGGSMGGDLESDFDGVMNRGHQPDSYHTGNMQAGDRNEPHRSMPRMIPDHAPPLKQIDVNTEHIYTHNIKGGRYKVFVILTPAGDSARQIGTVVGYRNIDAPMVGGYWRSMNDFCQSMQIVAFTPQDN